MSVITMRFLASAMAPGLDRTVSGGTVMKWIDEAGYACASGWARRHCLTVYASGVRFHHPIGLHHLVEVEARLAYTGHTGMNIAVEVRSGDVKGGRMLKTTECLMVFVAVDDTGEHMPVDAWKPGTPGEMALARAVRTQLEAYRTPQFA
ncbi:acyl-CoA thioesterase [Hydrogenophaga sp.]|uniref:acyl-CoA thioesterase n=1 Tax=Hydrogenophaga sp. TaxID=1904254 RepID=UPI003522DAE2